MLSSLIEREGVIFFGTDPAKKRHSELIFKENQGKEEQFLPRGSLKETKRAFILSIKEVLSEQREGDQENYFKQFLPLVCVLLDVKIGVLWMDFLLYLTRVTGWERSGEFSQNIFFSLQPLTEYTKRGK